VIYILDLTALHKKISDKQIVRDENRNLQYYTKNSVELTKCHDIEQSSNIYGMMVLKL
jgi:hypothetical protein